MKKQILTTLIVLCSISISSQISKIKFGVKSGVNLSKYNPDTYVANTKLADYKEKTGFYLGVYTNIKLSSKLSIQPELLFSNQGTEMLIDILEINSFGQIIGNSELNSEINENSISLPVVLRYDISDKFNFDLGIQLGYIVSLDEKIKNDFNSQINDSNTLISTTSYDRFDLGFNVGLGYKVHKNIRLNTRYFLGILERDNIIKPSIISLGIEYEL